MGHPIRNTPAPRHTYSYDAFISYRRSDGHRTANWLRRKLRAYRLPPPLQAGRREQLSVYLDRAYERAGPDYRDHVNPLLLTSEHLLLVATPDALRTRPDGTPNGVEDELALFRQSPQCNNIIAVVAKGDFLGALPGNLDQAMPNLSRVDLRCLGILRFVWPPHARQVHTELLKIVARLCDISPEEMPIFLQEEKRRRRMRLTFVALLVSLLGALGGSLGWVAYRGVQQQRASDSFAEYEKSIDASRKGEDDAALLHASEAASLADEDDPRAATYATRALQLARMMPARIVRGPALTREVHFFRGERLAYVRDQSGAGIWDPLTGTLVRDLHHLIGADIEARLLALSSDRAWLAGILRTHDSQSLVALELETGRRVELQYQGYLHHYSALEFTPDNRYTVLFGKHGSNIFDLRTGERVQLLGIDGPFLPNALCRTPSGLWLLQSSDGNAPGSALTIIDPISGTRRDGTVPLQHKGRVLSLRCPTFANRVATVSQGERTAIDLAIWDIETGALLSHHELAEERRLGELVEFGLEDIDSKGTNVLLLGSDHRLRLWQTHELSVRAFEASARYDTRTVKWSGLRSRARFVGTFDQIVVFGGHDMVQTKDANDFTQPTGGVTFTSFDFDTLSQVSFAVRLSWDALDVAVSDDGSVLNAAQRDGRFARWELASLPAPDRLAILSHTAKPKEGWLLANGTAAALLGKLPRESVYDPIRVETFAIESSRNPPSLALPSTEGLYEDEVKGLALNGASTLLAAAVHDRTGRHPEPNPRLELSLWDPENQQDLASRRMISKPGNVYAAALNVDRTTLSVLVTRQRNANAASDTHEVFDVATGRREHSCEVPGEAHVGNVEVRRGSFGVLSGDGAYYASASYPDTALWLWDTRNWTPVVRLEMNGASEGHKSLFLQLLAASSQTQVTGASSANLTIAHGVRWSLSSELAGTRIVDGRGRRIVLPRLPENYNLGRMALSPDGRFLATLGKYPSVSGGPRVWELDTGEMSGPALELSARVLDYTFSRDSTALITLSDDGIVRRWPLTFSSKIRGEWIPMLGRALTGRALTDTGIATLERKEHDALRAQTCRLLELESAHAGDGGRNVVFSGWPLCAAPEEASPPFGALRRYENSPQ